MNPRLPIVALLLTTGLALLAFVMTVPATTPVSAQPKNQPLAPEALVRKTGCLQCHSIDKAVVGPAYKDVAARYKGKPEARAELIEKVKKGGKGNWSDISKGVPMPPHQGRLSPADITRIVDWILSLDHN